MGVETFEIRLDLSWMTCIDVPMSCAKALWMFRVKVWHFLPTLRLVAVLYPKKLPILTYSIGSAKVPGLHERSHFGTCARFKLARKVC